jgi:hypothetical protein
MSVEIKINFIDPTEAPFHIWGDNTFDWTGLDEAISYIDQTLRRWRVNVQQSKEKYGTARIYCSLGLEWWPQLTHPGYTRNPWPRWLNFVVYGSYDKRSPLHWLLRSLNLVVVPFHKWLYRRTYAEAVRRWPTLRAEILACPDWPELLEGL